MLTIIDRDPNGYLVRLALLAFIFGVIAFAFYLGMRAVFAPVGRSSSRARILVAFIAFLSTPFRTVIL